MALETAGKEDYVNIRRLYKQAFPKEERAPFFILRRKALKGRADVLVAREDGVWIGFLYLICAQDLVYLFYFAIDETKRGKGYGSACLRQLQVRYRGKRLILAREQLDEAAENYQQRVSRHAFYRKNGFEDLPCRIREAGVTYDVMGIGGDVSPQEYEALLLRWGGKLLKCVTRMTRMEKES